MTTRMVRPAAVEARIRKASLLKTLRRLEATVRGMSIEKWNLELETPVVMVYEVGSHFGTPEHTGRRLVRLTIEGVK